MLGSKSRINSTGLHVINDEDLSVISAGGTGFRKMMMVFLGTFMGLGALTGALANIGNASKTWEMCNLLRNTLMATLGSAAFLGGVGSGIMLGNNVSKVLEEVQKQSLAESMNKDTESL